MHLTDRLHVSPSKWRSRLPKFVCLCSLSYESVSVGSLIFDLCLLDGNNESAFQDFNIFRYKGFLLYSILFHSGEFQFVIFYLADFDGLLLYFFKLVRKHY